ncbi:MAG: T9SS type A sorting domain-containing protein [bacterium]
MKTISTTLIVLFFSCATITAQNLMLSNGAKAIIGPGASFTFAEVVNDDPANLHIKSDETGSGSLIYTNTENDQPYATVELWVGNTEQWHLVSPPTTNTTALDFYIEGLQPTGLMWYDENVNYIPPPAPNAANGWTTILDLEYPIHVGQGYSYYQASERTAETGRVTFTGQLKSDDIDYSSAGLDLLQYSGPAPEQYGWNLIGNPYTAALVEGTGTVTEIANIEPAAWIWEGGNTNNYFVWRFPAEEDTEEHPIVIPMGQAFFVHAIDDQPEMKIYADNRKHNHDRPIYKKSEEFAEEVYGDITLMAYNNEATDKLVIELPIEEINTDEPRMSISKLFGPPESPQLFSREGVRHISIQTYPDYIPERIVDVGYIPGAEGDQLFTFAIDLPAEAEVYLEDRLTGWFQDLIENPEYAFQGSKEDDVDRFRIHFILTPDDVDEFAVEHEISIYAWDKAVYIKNPDPKLGAASQVYIYDMYGKVVLTESMHLNTLTRIPVTVSNSYLVVKVRNGDEVITEKVFIK